MKSEPTIKAPEHEPIIEKESDEIPPIPPTESPKPSEEPMETESTEASIDPSSSTAESSEVAPQATETSEATEAQVQAPLESSTPAGEIRETIPNQEESFPPPESQ